MKPCEYMNDWNCRPPSSSQSRPSAVWRTRLVSRRRSVRARGRQPRAGRVARCARADVGAARAHGIQPRFRSSHRPRACGASHPISRPRRRISSRSTFSVPRFTLPGTETCVRPGLAPHTRADTNAGPETTGVLRHMPPNGCTPASLRRPVAGDWGVNERDLLCGCERRELLTAQASPTVASSFLDRTVGDAGQSAPSPKIVGLMAGLDELRDEHAQLLLSAEPVGVRGDISPQLRPSRAGAACA